jgi:hypothetical protein
MDAVISDCGKYRYVLRRKTNCVLRWVRPILFIMLNPSTADATQDDPTIRRCIRFAEREQYTDLTVVNLFALRATDPKQLKLVDDPIGPENNLHIEKAVAGHRNHLIVAAWGAHPFARFRGHEVNSRFGPFECLGVTKCGDPRHPLYVRGDQEFSHYRPGGML